LPHTPSSSASRPRAGRRRALGLDRGGCLWNVHMAVKRESCRRNRRAPSTIACDRSSRVRARWESCEHHYGRSIAIGPAQFQRVFMRARTKHITVYGFDEGTLGSSLSLSLRDIAPRRGSSRFVGGHSAHIDQCYEMICSRATPQRLPSKLTVCRPTGRCERRMAIPETARVSRDITQLTISQFIRRTQFRDRLCRGHM
jgi:hypothetical protein